MRNTVTQHGQNHLSSHLNPAILSEHLPQDHDAMQSITLVRELSRSIGLVPPQNKCSRMGWMRLVQLPLILVASIFTAWYVSGCPETGHGED